MISDQHTDNEWDVREERLGSPDDPDAAERLAEITSEGWQFVGVLFGIGVWRFRRPKDDSTDRC